MRKFLIILASLLLCFCVYFVAVNGNGVVNFRFTNTKYILNFAVYSCLVLFSGICIGAIFVVQKYLSQGDTVNAYKRQLEKSSVQNDSNSSKVEILEAKIQTLEKALENALKNKN